MQALRLIGVGAFATASVFWFVTAIASAESRPIHLITAVVFLVVALLWLATYFARRSRA